MFGERAEEDAWGFPVNLCISEITRETLPTYTPIVLSICRAMDGHQRFEQAPIWCCCVNIAGICF